MEGCFIQYIGCAVIIFILFLLQAAAFYGNQLLQYLYTHYSPNELKILGVIIAIISGLYLLKPLYCTLSGKGKEKAALLQLQSDLLENDLSTTKAPPLYDVYENINPKPLPPVIKEIALITGSKSAGQNDFEQVLACGHYTLYATPMSESHPEEVISGIIQNIEDINLWNRADVICITRGGGSDLSNIFDSIDLANAIKASSLPILTGIGHATDHSLCDKVSDSPLYYGKKRYFITPTDLAHFLNEYNETQLLTTINYLSKLGNVTDHIQWKPIFIYTFILYVLNYLFFHYI
ncbi:MAG: exodeoxyribonuclease VII large subunit [Proteocatella sp.]